MYDNEIAHFRMGYGECREILDDSSSAEIRTRLENLIFQLEEGITAEYREQIQTECAGLTQEEYERECDEPAQMIRETYYSKNGFLKPRLVKSDIGETPGAPFPLLSLF